MTSTATAWLPQALARGRKGDRTREQLFQAAVGEFRRVGFAAASVGQIAARAGTSRAGFYVHYPHKEAVLLDLQWRTEIAIVERIRAPASLDAVFDELIEALIEVEAELVAGDLLRDMMSVHVRRPAGLDLANQPFPLRSELERRFAAARSELRAGLEPELASQLFLSALFGLLTGPRGPVAEQRAELRQLASLFLESPPVRSARARRSGR